MKNKFFVIEYHQGLFNPSKMKHTTVSEFSTFEKAVEHYGRVKDNCQAAFITENVTDKND